MIKILIRNKINGNLFLIINIIIHLYVFNYLNTHLGVFKTFKNKFVESFFEKKLYLSILMENIFQSIKCF